MSDFKIGDRVITVADMPPIAFNTQGTVKNVAAALTVKFDGDANPGRSTRRERVRKMAKNAVHSSDTNAVASAGKITFSNPVITAAAGPAAATTGVSTAIAGELVILFDSASVDLQNSGPLAGSWAGTFVFQLGGAPVAQNTRITIDVRGHIVKSADSAASVLVIVDGEPHTKRYPYKRVADGMIGWRITNTLRKGATTHTLTLVIAAERRTTSDLVRIMVDSFDVVVR